MSSDFCSILVNITINITTKDKDNITTKDKDTLHYMAINVPFTTSETKQD